MPADSIIKHLIKQIENDGFSFLFPHRDGIQIRDTNVNVVTLTPQTLKSVLNIKKIKRWKRNIDLQLYFCFN